MVLMLMMISVSTHADRQGVDISLLFACFRLCVCTVTDFSVQDKASGVKFLSVVQRRSRQGIMHCCELCCPRSPISDAYWEVTITVEMCRHRCHARDALFMKYCAACRRRFGMCGCRSFVTDVLVIITITVIIIIKIC